VVILLGGGFAGQGTSLEACLGADAIVQMQIDSGWEKVSLRRADCIGPC